MTDRRPHGSLAARLAVAFALVAIAAVAVLAAVILVTSNSETRRLSNDERERTAGDAAAALADAYVAAGSWARADTTAAERIAERADAVLVVLGPDGQIAAGQRGQGPGRGTGQHAAAVRAPVRVDGNEVGTAELRFRRALAESEQRVRSALADALLLGSAIAIALGLGVALIVGRRLGRPLGRLTRAARSVAAGDLGARAGVAAAPGELGELAGAFDGMAEALERQAASRRRMVSELAHELRTPVTVLRGNLEELVDGVAEPSSERLASLHEEVLRLTALVEDLDALTRAEDVAPRLEWTTVDLAALVRAAVDGWRQHALAKGIEVEAELAPAAVTGDRARLGQVVANLLSNALKFTPEAGRVSVRVGAHDGRATIAVCDSGPGIPEAERGLVHERFWRGAGAAGVAGRGIGLAVVDEIVRAHGGSVEIGEAPEGGARFVVSLPS